MAYWGKKKNKKTLPDQAPEARSVLIKEHSKQVPLEFACEVNLNEDESPWTTYFIQTRALLWKNYLLFSRKLRIVFFLLMAPVLVGWVLEFIIGLGVILHNSGVIDFKIESVGKVPLCKNGYYWDPRT